MDKRENGLQSHKLYCKKFKYGPEVPHFVPQIHRALVGGQSSPRHPGLGDPVMQIPCGYAG